MNRIKIENNDLNTEENRLLKQISFFESCSSIEQDFRGHSSALRYICEKNNQKYFIKIYKNNRLKDIKYIDSIYKELQIPTAEIFELDYFEKFDRTFVVYEFIEGKTLLELTKELSLKEIEDIGKSIGKYLSKFKTLKCDEETVISLFEKEIKKLIENLYYMKDYYDKNGNSGLKCIDIDRLYSNFCEYKKYIYATKPAFIHKDINLNNVLVKDNNIFFIDTDGGKFSFSVLDFRGICWWTWDGENKVKEQAMYRGIFKGLLGNNIPYTFNKELAFTVMYEFLLKIEEVSKSKDLKRMEYIFSKFGDIFIETNYFKNYRFDWLN